MATTIYETVTIELIDGSEVILRPLKISTLRQFMVEFQKVGEEGVAEDNIKSIDILFECARIAMTQYKPEIADTETLEELIDLPLVYKVIEVASGIKLNDPNALAAALAGQN